MENKVYFPETSLAVKSEKENYLVDLRMYITLPNTYINNHPTG